MKVMSWNIWKGKHLNNVIALIRRENPDIIGLQEVTEKDNNNIGKEIAQKLNYQFLYCKSFTTDRHTPSFDQGNAILTRLPVISSECHFLSTLEHYEKNAATEPRTVMEVTLSWNDKQLIIFNTHLGFAEKFGESEMKNNQLLNLLKFLPKKNTILMGDFNSQPDSTVIKEITRVLVNTDSHPTEPTIIDVKDKNQTKYRIDYIFTTPDMRTNNFQIIESSASDHFPLMVEVI